MPNRGSSRRGIGSSAARKAHYSSASLALPQRIRAGCLSGCCSLRTCIYAVGATRLRKEQQPVSELPSNDNASSVSSEASALRALIDRWRAAKDWQTFGPSPRDCANELEAALASPSVPEQTKGPDCEFDVS